MYKAKIVKLDNVRIHPNADRLYLADACGYQVIVSKEIKEGDLGIYFPTDGCLDHNFLMVNKLYNKDPITGEKMGGFFDSNRRVRTQRFRGEPSEGFWIPIKALEYTGNISKLKDGYTFDEINGKHICEKYITLATQAKMTSNKIKRTKKIDRIKFPTFKKHFVTEQLRYEIDRIPIGAIISISLKIHGTSGRTGRHIVCKIPQTYIGKLFINIKNKIVQPKQEYEYVSGSRNILLNPKTIGTEKFNKDKYRSDIHNMIKNIGLYKGETIFYEIVGYTTQNKPIMGTYSIKDKDIEKKYGKNIIFSYGTKQEDPNRQYKIYVYRITIDNEDKCIELPWYQMQYRCKQLGLDPVPQLVEPIRYESKKDLIDMCKKLANGPDPLDKTHPREGVVIRIEHPEMFKFLKYKGPDFCILEGIAKQDINYIDTEEVA